MPVPKGTRIGGRQKGTPNKNPNELKALARTYTAEAVKTLVKHMRGDDPRASVTATKEILDRGHGKTPMAPEDREALDEIGSILAGAWSRMGGARAA